MKKPEVLSGQGSKRFAHNLDFVGSNHKLHTEDPISHLNNPNDLEKLIQEGSISLHTLPPESIDAIKGKHTNPSRGRRGYQAYISDSGDISSIDLTDELTFSGQPHKVIAVGKATGISYKKPGSSQRSVGHTEYIDFIVLQRKSKKIGVRDPRG